VVGVMSGGLGDVGPAGQAEQADGGVAQGRHHVGRVAGADLGAVLIEGDIADPVQPVRPASGRCPQMPQCPWTQAARTGGGAGRWK